MFKSLAFLLVAAAVLLSLGRTVDSLIVGDLAELAILFPSNRHIKLEKMVCAQENTR